MKQVSIVAVLLYGPLLCAQGAIPNGTILPVELNSSLNSKKSAVGQKVTARVAQDVPLPSGARIRAGSKVVGHVVAVSPASRGSAASLSLQFDTLQSAGRSVAITTDLRTLASMMEVVDAQRPQTGPDRGTPPTAWVTMQIGGEVNYHGGPVMHGAEVVGESVLGGGALGTLRPSPDPRCRAEIDGNREPQALWLFASDACGAYGFTDLAIAHAGRTAPVGQITLTAANHDVRVSRGSGLLLRVVLGSTR